MCVCVCVLGDGSEFQLMCHTNLPQPSTVSYYEKIFDCCKCSLHDVAHILQ